MFYLNSMFYLYDNDSFNVRVQCLVIFVFTEINKSMFNLKSGWS